MSKFIFPHVAITVRDIEATKKFYTTIGFGVVFEDISVERQRHVVLFEGYQLQIEAFSFDDQEKSYAPKQEYKKVGFLHFALAVQDLHALRDEFVQKGITIDEDIRRTSLGVLHFTLLDPSGITVEFFQKELSG